MPGKLTAVQHQRAERTEACTALERGHHMAKKAEGNRVEGSSKALAGGEDT